MTKYILHGGFTSVPNELNRTFYAEITKGLEDGAIILIICFARDPKEWDTLFKQDKERILKTTECKDLNIIRANTEDFENQVKQCDALYIRGGDTEKLIKILNQYPTFTQDIEGKVCVGSSAGAYVWAQYYHSASKGEIREGLGLLPIKIIAHYGSDKFPMLNDDAIEAMKALPDDLGLVVLKDHEWKVFTS